MMMMCLTRDFRISFIDNDVIYAVLLLLVNKTTDLLANII